MQESIPELWADTLPKRVSIFRSRETTPESLEEDTRYVGYIEYLEEQEEDAWEYFQILEGHVERLSAQEVPRVTKETLEKARKDARVALASHDKIVGAIGLAHRRHWDYLVEGTG